MQSHTRRWRARAALTIGLALAALALPAIAQLQIVRQTLLPAAESTGGDFVLRGTLGQPQTGRSAAGGFRVEGGFHRAGSGDERLFADGFEAGVAGALTTYDSTEE